MGDDLERAKERFKHASDRLDQVWPDRVNDPESTRAAVDELDDAVRALVQAWNAHDAAS